VTQDTPEIRAIQETRVTRAIRATPAQQETKVLAEMLVDLLVIREIRDLRATPAIQDIRVIRVKRVIPELLDQQGTQVLRATRVILAQQEPKVLAEMPVDSRVIRDLRDLLAIRVRQEIKVL
jgi:hypothetical protein